MDDEEEYELNYGEGEGKHRLESFVLIDLILIWSFRILPDEDEDGDEAADDEDVEEEEEEEDDDA